MRPLQKIKEDLKNLAHNIRVIRRASRLAQSTGQPYVSPELKPCETKVTWLERMSWDFRHRHVAYCVLRGTPREAIENPATLRNPPDEKLIEKYLAQYQEACRETLCAG